MHPGRFGSLRHLAERFVGALSPAPPPAADEAWARAQLLDGERDLWERMSGPDRRHAVAVARAALATLEREGPAAPRAALAAALLHDIGKLDSRLGTFSRVAVTCASVALPPARLPSRARRYVEHDRIGAQLLLGAGSDPLTVAWAREHHLPPERWTLDRRLGEILKAADGG